MTNIIALAVLVCTAASAAPAPKPASCLHPAGKKAKPPKTLEALKSCQKRVKRALETAAQKKGKPLSDDQLDAVDDVQRAETREFMAASHEVIGAREADVEVPSSASGGGDGGGRGDSASDGPRGGQGGAQNDGAAGKDDGGPDHESTGDRDTSEAGDIQRRFTAAGVMPAPGEIEAIKAAMFSTRGHVTPEISRMISNIIADHKRKPANP